jgi:ribose 5-phosphate isomerase A
MSAQSKKRAAAEAALAYVPDDEVIGVGTGSTVNFFIDALAARKVPIKGAVSSSESSTSRLRQHGIDVLDLNAVGDLEVYVDGADEADPQLHLIKGGGAALTREKIVAAASRRFVCIVDDSNLGPVPGPVPRTRSARTARAAGARPP